MLTVNSPNRHICPHQKLNVASKLIRIADGSVKILVNLEATFDTCLSNLIVLRFLNLLVKY